MESSKGVADLSSTDDFLSRAAAHGVKVLFSVVCAPGWSRADGGAGGSGPPDDMQNAADFMGGLAGKYCNSALGAIEVWNEHNLLVEWHGKPLSAPLYADMLKRSYASIKARCPGIVVVAGAPTPTGWNDWVVAVDDAEWIEKMYQAMGGSSNGYFDALGAHPSGYNNPPDVNADWTDPSTTQGKGHRSWFFKATMETYRNIMVKYGDANKQIWPTEFGWAVGSHPNHPTAVDNTAEEQAAWLVKAYQMMKAWGWVGVAFTWNLDFYGGEVGVFHIEGTPAFQSLMDMPK